MARSIIFAIVTLVVAMCVGFSAASAPLVRSTPGEQERVFDFTISESRDSASWTAFGREWHVQLELSDVVEDNTDYYLGTLEGDASAAVSFVMLPGTSFSGMIATGETTFWIKAMPVVENNLSEEDEDLGIFMVREKSVQTDVELPSFETPLVPEEAEEAEEEGAEKRAITSYKVALFVDQKWTSTANPWRSQANTIGLFNDINAIYKAAGLATFQVVYQKQITRSATTLNSMLSTFQRTSLSAYSDKSYTNYMWLIGQNVGGLAYVGTSCRSATAQTSKTGVAGLVASSRLWTVKTIAHELGHNRGAPHEFTNQCSGSLRTNCQCSLMSYCFPTSSNNPKGAVNYLLGASISKMKAAGCY